LEEKDTQDVLHNWELMKATMEDFISLNPSEVAKGCRITLGQARSLLRSLKDSGLYNPTPTPGEVESHPWDKKDYW